MATVSDEIAELLRKCNKCGFCQAGCPIYKATGVEWSTARGRIELVRSALLDHKLGLDELDESVFNCLTCNNCTEHCPPAIRTGDIIFRAREEILKQQGQPWIQRLLFKKLLSNPSLLNKTSRLLRLTDVTGLRTVARKTGLMKLIGDTGRVEAMVPRAPANSGLKAISRLATKLENPRYRVAYFPGCHASSLSPGVAEATIRVLHRHQVEVTVPEFACCGLPAAGYGDTSSARSMAQRNVGLAQNLSVDAVITPCGSCSSFLKEYGKLLAEDPEWSQKAREFAAKVKDLSEFLMEIGLNTEMKTIHKKVTYHDPCHLAHYQKIKEQPRTILKSIPGVEFTELAEASTCCGAAGTYGCTHYDLSMKVLDRKMGNVAKAGADILVTSCPGCVMQLAHGVHRHKIPTRVSEIAVLLDEAYTIDED